MSLETLQFTEETSMNERLGIIRHSIFSGMIYLAKHDLPNESIEAMELDISAMSADMWSLLPTVFEITKGNQKAVITKKRLIKSLREGIEEFIQQIERIEKNLLEEKKSEMN